MRIKRAISLSLVMLLTVMGAWGCMSRENMYGAKKRKESNEEYAGMMLEYIENKYSKNFEVVEYNFPEEGFNTGHLQNTLVVKEKSSGAVTDVYATLAEPYLYYDHYVSDFASWENQRLVSEKALEYSGSAKLYLYLRNEDANAPDASKENVSRVVLVVNINEKPNVQTMEKLYGAYNELFALDYEHIFMIVGFTESREAFDKYVQSYRVYGKKKWEDLGGKVYATLTAQNAGLTFEAFQNLCEYK